MREHEKAMSRKPLPKTIVVGWDDCHDQLLSFASIQEAGEFLSDSRVGIYELREIRPLKIMHG